ncbi:hypothetical protein V8C43DRAFT_163346 [Trichoderma afarasin]
MASPLRDTWTSLQVPVSLIVCTEQTLPKSDSRSFDLSFFLDRSTLALRHHVQKKRPSQIRMLLRRFVRLVFGERKIGTSNGTRNLFIPECLNIILSRTVGVGEIASPGYRQHLSWTFEKERANAT